MTGFYSASDYAGIQTRNAQFYYGYERTQWPDNEDDQGDWCFVATIQKQKHLNGETEEIVIPFGSIEGATDMFNCDECLMAGIAMILGNYRLELD
jgi:hypothetical protein